MKPVTREEQYLNRLTGEEQEIPEEPVTREEQYLARLCGQTNSIPEKPVTRREEYLANLCGEDVIIPEEQVTRMEQYMAFAAGARETKPEEPVTREEWYWDKYQGGDVPEEKTIAFTDIITVTDALARPAVDLQSEITATQNLNGYEYPWVGGAGKNLCPKFSQVSQSGITVTVADDGTLTINGTATATVNMTISGLNIPAGTYTLSLNNPTTVGTSASNSIYAFARNTNNAWVMNPIAKSANAVGTGTTEYPINVVVIVINSGVSVSNYIMKPQLELGSTASAYTPYENICPITGRNTATVYHGATEQTAVAITTALGRTVYGGTLDLTTGELKITHAYVDLGDLYWTLSNFSNTFQIFINEKKSGQTNFITTSYRTVAKRDADLANGEATCISPMPHAEIYKQICIKDERATTAEEFTTLVTGQKMVYELATPQTISLTPTEVQMLENNNTIWADSGRVQLTYLSRAAKRVQLMNASLKANTLKISKGAVKK